MENGRNIIIGTIGHKDHSFSELLKRIEDVHSKGAVDNEPEKKKDYEKIVHDATLLSLLLADVDELIDTDWDAVLGRKVEPKGHTMLPKRRYPRRK